MLKRRLWKVRISLLLALLAACSASCKRAGAVEETLLGKPAEVSPAVINGLASGAGGRGAFHFDGKDYFISAGAASGGRGLGLTLSIPASSGLRLDGFIGGAKESSVTVTGGSSAASLMESLARELTRQGYVKKSEVMGGGLASATWILAGGSASARIFAMEQDGLAAAKLVARLEGNK